MFISTFQLYINISFIRKTKMALVSYSTVPYYSYSVLCPCRRSSTLSGWRPVSWGQKAWPCWTVLIRARWKTSRASWPCSAPVHLLQLCRLTTALTRRALSHLATPKNTRPNRYREKYLQLVNNELKFINSWKCIHGISLFYTEICIYSGNRQQRLLKQFKN